MMACAHAPVKEPLGYEFCTISQGSVSLRPLHGIFFLTLNGAQDLQSRPHLCKHLGKDRSLYYTIHVRVYLFTLEDG